MDFKAAFKHTPTWVNYVLGLVIVIGVTGVVVGSVLDARDGWNELSFAPNIFTSFVSFCIGLPFAYFVVATVVENRTDRLEAERVGALTQEAWAALAEACNDLLTDELIEALNGPARRVSESYTNLARDMPQLLAQDDEAATHRALARANQEMIAASAKVCEVMAHPDLANRKWTGIRGDWRLIDEEVRIRRRQLHLPWMDRYVDSTLRMLIGEGESPLDDFAHLLLLEGELEKMVDSMADVARYLDQMSRAEMGRIVNEWTSSTINPMRHHPEKDYDNALNKAIRIANEIRTIVAVDASHRFA